MQLFSQTAPASGLATLDHLVIGIYLAAMMTMGFYLSFRQKSTEDFFLAGRNLPSWAVGISLMASLLSTITYLATPGEMFRSGPNYLFRYLGIPLVLMATWFIWVPFFMRLRLTSAYEYLERRFNYATRALAAFFCLMLILGWMAVVVLTASKAMTEIVQLDLNWFFGRNIPATQTMDDGSAVYVPSEILDGEVVADRILASAEEETAYGWIFKQMTVEEQESLRESTEKQTTVAAIFNRLLSDKELYNSEAWEDVPLTETAQTFTGVPLEQLTHQELTHYNRALLKSVFPTELSAATPAYADADMHALIISVGLFSVLYTTLGGLRAVVWTDVIQFFVLILGAFLTIGIIAWVTTSTPVDWFNTVTERKYEEVEWYSFDVGNRSTVLFIVTSMFFWSFCTHGANQVALQRYFSTRNVREGRKSYLVSAFSDIVLGLVLGCVGMALVYYVQHPDVSGLLPTTADLDSAVSSIRTEAQDKVFPQFIRIALPDGVRGLVVAALFAAAMSTIDSGANSISTIVTVDYYRPFAKEQATAKAELRLARTLTASMGLLIVVSTIFIYHLSKGTDLISICQKGFNCFLGPLGGLFFVGVFSPYVSSRSAILGVLVGEVVGVCASYSQELFNASFSTHLVIAAAWFATVVSAHIFAMILRDFATEEQRRWMFRPVLNNDIPDVDELSRSNDLPS
ncbi:Sodium/glucose cotransporter [Polystyrenella longa]|uniref:Sodium/glucose cotransporter n=1 Tax=Polystyrenella longa TaxID=2528007 RepID=A0A518CLW0_9PLAN|nr:hypothetical protein [Polystyrenella longa]QDU80208.1 Sodium/glucose cotransporter [Polystyrenella longa]